MSFTKFITTHFGGIPRSLKDLEWIYRVNPDLPAYLPPAKDYRVVSPGNQPAYQRPIAQALSKNQYFKRDVRRSYPRTLVVANAENPLLPGGEAAAKVQVDAASVILNNRYQYQDSAPELKPDSSNPEFSIRGVK